MKKEGKIFRAIGLMSGTSLDGLDIVAAEFWQQNGNWCFKIVSAETAIYTAEWFEKLKTAHTLAGDKLLILNNQYGRFLGQEAKKFCHKTGFNPDLIASHGHTVFHDPEKGFTFQLGNGNEIAATTGITTVADFRTGDVALGGQGAPLVPAGDKLLFYEYDYCLNLGGFSNISFDENDARKAFDICPVNIVFNEFASKRGHLFDNNGDFGRAGEIDFHLLDKLNSLDFYQKQFPKSLGREWVEQVFLPVFHLHSCAENNKIRTVYEHVALQISKTILPHKNVLATGGGVWNKFLIELIASKTTAKIIIPAAEIADFKEALVFAFLGVLKTNNQVNCFASVTGAKHDHSAGTIFN